MKRFILLGLTALGLCVLTPGLTRADDGVIVRFPGGIGYYGTGYYGPHSEEWRAEQFRRERWREYQWRRHHAWREYKWRRHYYDDED
jgi:hypothetical protein